MANFMEELWSSIFTPGATPTLLVATNVTFGALLALLIALLVATRSVHFLVLTVLSSGLWWAINWFAREVRLAQESEGNTKNEKSGAPSTVDRSNHDISGDAMDTGDDTETEVDEDRRRREQTPQVKVSGLAPSTSSTENRALSSGTERSSTFNSSASTELEPQTESQIKKRQRQSMAESTGSLSTDSEWEKVDDEK